METPRKTVKLWGSDSFKAEPEKTEGNKNIYHFCTCNASFQKALAMFRFHLSKIYKSIN